MIPTPIYDLLTDKDGNPLPEEPRARYARVGFKERMGPGRWPMVMDHETKEPLVFPLQDSYANFHRAVGGQPGHYQLVILDGDYHVISKELVGHLTITSPRNAAPDAAAASMDPVVLRALALVEQAMNRAMDVCERMVEQRAGTVSAEADLLKANAEVTRAAIGITPHATTSPTASATIETEDEEDEEREPTLIESVAMQVLNAGDVWWETKKMHKAKTAPKPAPKAEPAGHPQLVPPPAGPVSSSSTPNGEPPPAQTEPSTQPQPSPATASGIAPTPEQSEKVAAVLAKLTNREQLAAQMIVGRLSPAERAEWLTELSALTVDQAVERVRDHLPEKMKGGAK